MITTERIFIDIDSLIDLRQGRLSYFLDEDALSKFITSERYNFRSNDDFSDICNMEDYNKIEVNRELIERSMVSQMTKILRSKISNLESRRMFEDKITRTVLVVNFNNSKITEGEQKSFLEVVSYCLDLKSMPEAINLKTKDVTPLYLKTANVVMAFIYNSFDWIPEHVDIIQKMDLSNVNVFFPSIYNTDMDTILANSEKLNKLGFRDGFTIMEMIFAGHLIVQFLPIYFYSNTVVGMFIDELMLKKTKETSFEKQEEKSVSIG